MEPQLQHAYDQRAQSTGQRYRDMEPRTGMPAMPAMPIPDQDGMFQQQHAAGSVGHRTVYLRDLNGNSMQTVQGSSNSGPMRNNSWYPQTFVTYTTGPAPQTQQAQQTQQTQPQHQLQRQQQQHVSSASGQPAFYISDSQSHGANNRSQFVPSQQQQQQQVMVMTTPNTRPLVRYHQPQSSALPMFSPIITSSGHYVVPRSASSTFVVQQEAQQQQQQQQQTDLSAELLLPPPDDMRSQRVEIHRPVPRFDKEPSSYARSDSRWIRQPDNRTDERRRRPSSPPRSSYGRSAQVVPSRRPRSRSPAPAATTTRERHRRSRVRSRSSRRRSPSSCLKQLPSVDPTVSTSRSTGSTGGSRFEAATSKKTVILETTKQVESVEAVKTTTPEQTTDVIITAASVSMTASTTASSTPASPAIVPEVPIERKNEKEEKRKDDEVMREKELRARAQEQVLRLEARCRELANSKQNKTSPDSQRETKGLLSRYNISQLQLDALLAVKRRADDEDTVAILLLYVPLPRNHPARESTPRSGAEARAVMLELEWLDDQALAIKTKWRHAQRRVDRLLLSSSSVKRRRSTSPLPASADCTSQNTTKRHAVVVRSHVV